MAQNKGIRIHQYQDNWSVRGKSHRSCFQDTQNLVALYRELDWIVIMNKSELEPKQFFNFKSYQFDFRKGKVKPTLECWQTLNLEIQKLFTKRTCRI